MGLLSKLFSKRPKYPLLDPNNPAARRVTKVLRPLETLSESVSEDLEVVPGSRKTFVFMGKPPKRFGLAWIEAGKIHNLKDEAQKSGVSASHLATLGEKLRMAYEQSQQEDRYRVTVRGKDIVVIPSGELEVAVTRVVSEAID